MTGVRTQRGNLDTDTYTGRVLCEDWSHASTSQGNIRNQGRGLEQSLPRCLQRAHGPTDTLISDFQSLELGDNKFLLFEPLSLQFFVTTALVSSYTDCHISCWGEGFGQTLKCFGLLYGLFHHPRTWEALFSKVTSPKNNLGGLQRLQVGCNQKTQGHFHFIFFNI